MGTADDPALEGDADDWDDVRINTLLAAAPVIVVVPAGAVLEGLPASRGEAEMRRRLRWAMIVAAGAT